MSHLEQWQNGPWERKNSFMPPTSKAKLCGCVAMSNETILRGYLQSVRGGKGREPPPLPRPPAWWHARRGGKAIQILRQFNFSPQALLISSRCCHCPSCGRENLANGRNGILCAFQSRRWCVNSHYAFVGIIGTLIWTRNSSELLEKLSLTLNNGRGSVDEPISKRGPHLVPSWG